MNELEPTVPRRLMRGYVTALFILVMMAFAISSVAIVRGQRIEADTQVARQLNEASIYANNHAACGLRALVDPTIAAQKRSLVLSTAASKDKTSSPTARARSKKNIASLEKSLEGLTKVRALYGTIPPGYDCSKLPKLPPTVNT